MQRYFICRYEIHLHYLINLAKVASVLNLTELKKFRNIFTLNLKNYMYA